MWLKVKLWNRNLESDCTLLPVSLSCQLATIQRHDSVHSDFGALQIIYLLS